MGKLYRYESITSELKVWAERSPLSEWTDTTIVKKLRFQILFKQASNQIGDRAEPLVIPKIIRGNQNHLESLIAAIAIYVEDLLSQSSNQDFEVRLFHQLFIPNFPKFNQLQFSTLELFDLLTNLELFTRELKIFPSILDASLGGETRHNPIWFRVAAAAIATVSITTATRFLFPPEYSRQSIANLSSTENSAEPPSESKPELKSPNNSRNTQPVTPIPPSSKAALNKKETPNPDLGRIYSNKPQIPANTRIAKIPKPQPESLLKSIPSSPVKSAPPESSRDLTRALTSLSQPEITNPNQSKNEFLPSESEQTSLGLSDTSKLNGDTPKPSPQRTEIIRTEIIPSTSSQIRRDRDRLSNFNNGTIKGKNPEITEIKIDGSPNSQELHIYRQKIEKWEYQKFTGEINIEVRWQNRQITELKIQPENPELTELVGRSLFETFSDQDGNIQINLKVSIP